jgi:hypothetical protein
MSRVKLATAALLSALGLEVIGQEASTFLARVQALSLESLPGPVVALLQSWRARSGGVLEQPPQ